MSNLAVGLRFSKLDLSQAYLQIILNPESHKYVTIATHKGLYQCTRVPFWIATSHISMQYGYNFTRNPIYNTLLDDISVTGKSTDVHLDDLEEVLRRLGQHGLRVRPSKCAFIQESVKHLSHKNWLERVQTALHYYGKFIPNLSITPHPLNRLLQASTEWKWDGQCDKVFKEAKEKLVSAPILVHYGPFKKLKFAAYASAHGIDTVILHVFANGCERPIAYVSRTLSKAKQHYTQIDNEAMALISGVQHFYQYLYGRKFVWSLTTYTTVINCYVMHSKIYWFSAKNSNSIISCILYNQFLIDRGSCSNIVGYFMMLLLDEYIRTVRKTSSTTDLFTGLEAS